MEKGYRYLQGLALALSILTPCILLAGYAFWLGHISAFDLSAELMPKTLTDVLLESWTLTLYLVIFVLAPNLIYILIGTIFLWVGLVVIAYIVNFLAERKLIDPNAPEITQENKGKRILGLTQWMWKNLFNTGGLMYRASTALVLGICAVSMIVLYPYTFGEKESKKQVEKFQLSECGTTIKCHKLIDSSKGHETLIAEGILISATENKVAIYDGVASVYPLLDSYKLVVHPITKSVKAEKD